MARRAPNLTAEERELQRQDQFQILKGWLIGATVVSACLVAVLFGWQETQQFLLREPQFVLPAPADSGEEGPTLEITGVKNASRQRLAATFDRDYGRSLYLLSPERRRLDLLANSWVAEASVTRIWPNKVRVKIAEREPVAWVQLPEDEDASRPALVDGEGNILFPQSPGQFRLPVLLGLDDRQSEEDRKLRVKRFLRLVAEAGDRASKISEVDVKDPANLKVMLDEGGRIITLIVGNRHYKRRFEKFRLSFPDIQRREPDATTFDLRIDGSILSIPTEPEEQAQSLAKRPQRGNE